jgi:TrmH family RNA methyltransferase
MAADITSPTNDRIKRLVRLRQRRHRDDEGVLVVEGRRELERAVNAGLSPREVYLRIGDAVNFPGSQVFFCSAEAMAKASYQTRPDAVIGIVDQFDTSLDRIALGFDPMILVAEGLEKPGNLGAILRTADAAGADAVIAVDSRVDPFNPNVIRASTGAIFTVPFADAALDETLQWLQSSGISVLAASPHAETLPWGVDLTGRVALMVGSEDIGLSDAAAAAAGRLIRIPMLGAVDSLNTSVSMAILAYEAVRQRSK